MKKVLLILSVCFLNFTFFNFSIICFADTAENEMEGEIENQIEGIDFSGVDTFFSEFSFSENSIFGQGSFLDKVKQIMSGKLTTDYSSIFSAIFEIIKAELSSMVPLMATIIAVAVLSSIINNMRAEVAKKSVGNIIHFVMYAFIITLVCFSVMQVVNLTSEVLVKLKTQMDFAFPVLLTLMTAIGSVVSASVYQPGMAILSLGITEFFNVIVLPLFLISFIFSVVSNLSANISLQNFSKTISSCYKWLVGAVFTIFTGFMAIQGITASSYDSISIRATKFAVKSYVPLLGGYLSDGFNMIIGSSVLIKNAVGLAGVLLVFVTIISPIIKILILKFSLQIAGAVLEPIADKRISNFLTSVSKNLMMLIVVILGVSFMYFILVGLVITTSNVTV